MTLNHRTFDNEVRNSTFGEIVQIATTDTCVFDTDANIALIAELWYCSILEYRLSRRLEYERLVLDATFSGCERWTGSRLTVSIIVPVYRVCRSTERPEPSRSGPASRFCTMFWASDFVQELR